MPDKEAMRLGGLILAGGRSRRMGRAKESLPIGDTTLLGWQCRTLAACTDPVVVVRRDDGQALPDVPESVDVTADDAPGIGPLCGLAAGLARLRDRHGFGDRDAAFVTGCDLPFVTDITHEHPAFRVQVPSDHATVRNDTEAAMRWRLVVREVVQILLSRGYTVTGFQRPAVGHPSYLFHRTAKET